MSDKYQARKIAIFYIYANYFNENDISVFLENKENVDLRYIETLISLYRNQQKIIKKLLSYILKKERLTTFHMVLLMVMVAENYIVEFTDEDVRDYIQIANKYADQFLIDIIYFAKKSNILKLAQ
ncbi:hypothetical protein DESAMIL20_691 [Desulfurella amilsii]|uniref:NusB/RsmB/TIM44 domain-containing protein n=1 Tax=Desulfurella amilsii TaxID=1562698 RepID=A0A1X4XY95_9BACT|nr:hypothetical protein [Desulfurella amilsii]OSS42507.1 hypothetical protein DESAMIL20_691 [Desulfurella amilsii]